MIPNAISDSKNQIIKENKGNQMKLGLIGPTPKEPILVEADKWRINQVLSNFLNNAIRLTDEGSICVTVDKSSIKKEVLVRTVDTGSGIELEMIPRLFTKFATKSTTGTGLGLYISKNIIEAYGGKIWAENNKDDKGLPLVYRLKWNRIL